MSNDIDQKDEEKEDLSEKSRENNVNYGNLDEKKKTGFFSMLSNLMTTDKKITETSDKIPEKKQKSKKTKTDPNLFLFNDVVEEQSELSKKSSEVIKEPEISDISESNNENDTIEDIDTPSYLRKGSSQ